MTIIAKYYIDKPKELYDKLINNIDNLFDYVSQETYKIKKKRGVRYKVRLMDGVNILFEGYLYIVPESLSSIQYVLTNDSDVLKIRFEFYRSPDDNRYLMKISLLNNNRDINGMEKIFLTRIFETINERIRKVFYDVGIEPTKDLVL
ncbi:MAG: hypothetical protein JHC19_07845 [Desulfurococcaceae archaeon]|nr:hypothetical protein [Desulfurococcaceae archaeon]